MTTPANLPNQVGVQGIGAQLTLWIARAANAVNWLLGGATGRARASNFTTASLAFSTTSTTPVSTGFSASITPTYSGTVICLAQAEIGIPTSDIQWANIWYGTGTAPAANAAMTGTILNPTVNTPSFGVGVDISVPIVGAAFGLSIGTTYWFTLGTYVTASTGNTNRAAITLIEI